VVDTDAIFDPGLLPPVRKQVVDTAAIEVGFDAAMFLTGEGSALGEVLAQ